MMAIRSPGSIFRLMPDRLSTLAPGIAETGVLQLDHDRRGFPGRCCAPRPAARRSLSIIRLQRIQRRQRLARAGDEEGELADRRHGAAGEHDDGDDRAHRDLALVEQVEAADHQADADRCWRQRGEVDRDRGQPAHLFLRRGRHRGIAAPAAEHLAFGARRLERFDARRSIRPAPNAAG